MTTVADDRTDGAGPVGATADEPLPDHRPEAVPVLIDDRLEVELPAGGRMVVVSDLHLGAVATERSTSVAGELADLLDGWSGPGLFVIAGDGFELLAGPPDVDAILDAHLPLTEALARFSSVDDRRVVVLSNILPSVVQPV